MRSDEDLVDALRGGDVAAFDALYARYERRLFGYVLRMVHDQRVAEDMFQDVLLTVLRDRTFDPSRGRFSAWLFTVARNRCSMWQRGQKIRDDHAVARPAAPESPEDTVDTRRRVWAAMAALTEPQQQLVLLKQVGELTYGEIATIVGVAEGTVKSRLHAAMKAFRHRLTELTEG